MKINEISNNPLSNINSSDLKGVKSEFKFLDSSIQNNSREEPIASWQKDILLTALDKLENNIQLDNSHPLSNKINAPIESRTEALIELSFLKYPKFAKEGIESHSNINHRDVLYLFMDN